jgi:hypothetical protein
MERAAAFRRGLHKEDLAHALRSDEDWVVSDTHNEGKAKVRDRIGGELQLRLD